MTDSSEQSVRTGASMRDGDDVPVFELLDPEFQYESFTVAQARERSWYATTELGLLVLRHREGYEILRDRRFRLGGEYAMDKLGLDSGPFYELWMDSLFSASPSDHARLRGLVNRAFAPAMVERLRAFARATAERLAAHITAGSDCEFVDAFAEPLPALVMCEMLGVPPQDYEDFRRCSSDIGLAFTRSLDGLQPRVDAAAQQLSEYVRALLTARRRQPGDDLISSLIAAEEDGDRLSERELQNLVLWLVWAGQDTTARQLGRALVAFAEHPEQWTLLAEHPEIAPQAVDEVCRWTPQSRSPMRYPIEDLEYRGVTIPQGTMVLISTVAANRDPRVFEDPERFDISVARRGRALTFGGGIHHCLGAAVARMEMAEGLLALAQRLGPPRVAGEIVWRHPMARIHGPDVLPLRFAPAAAAGS